MVSPAWTEISLEPGFYFIATPLGNARDITLRALDVLASADVLAAEDTRRLKHLLDIHAVPLKGRRILSYHDHNGQAVRPALLSAVSGGQSVAYASDAGSPMVADPGFVLGREAIANGHPVYSVPGPAAVIAGLTVSGLPSDRFTFAGFPPHAKGARRTFLASFGNTSGTLVLYESPNRIAQTLDDAADLLGEGRPCVLARELTKKFEEVRRGSLGEVRANVKVQPPRGEIVLLIGAGKNEVSQEDVDTALKAAMEGLRLKDAAREVAEQFGLSRRDLYQRGLELQDRNAD
ncbi:MAG: 16S rRNA (cytidine(1402)-2'-O)-methyltransferase [Pseudomonadota bacterium]